MVTLEKIRGEALEAKAIFSRCTSIGALRDLSSIGIEAFDVSVNEGKELRFAYEKEKVNNFNINWYPDSHLSNLSYDLNTGKFSFDVFLTEGLKNGGNWIKGATLETLDSLWKENVRASEISFSPVPGFVNLNDPETKKLVLAVISTYFSQERLGSYAEPKAAELLQRLKYEDYCMERGIEVSEMDEYDYENAEGNEEYEME